jgi:hypothetical protein
MQYVNAVAVPFLVTPPSGMAAHVVTQNAEGVAEHILVGRMGGRLGAPSTEHLRRFVQSGVVPNIPAYSLFYEEAILPGDRVIVNGPTRATSASAIGSRLLFQTTGPEDGELIISNLDRGATLRALGEKHRDFVILASLGLAAVALAVVVCLWVALRG